MGDPIVHPTNVGCSFFRYINDDVTNHYEQRPKRRTWTREENQLVLECYFRSNPFTKRIQEKNDGDLARTFDISDN